MNPEEIKKILEEHEIWLASDKKKGKRADFKGVSLYRANFVEANLQGANLEDASLHDANLQGAYLLYANLQRANLQGAQLQAALLMEADLQRANLQGAQLRGAHLMKADLQRANLQGAILIEADLHRANLEGANFQGANLQGAKLINTILIRATLDQAHLEDAELRGIFIDKTTASKLPKSVIKEYGHTFFVTEWPDHLDTESLIVRSIEFPPEYYQAGISILNYFGTILRKKYPEQNAKIRIEQEGLKITMIVDPLEGDREVIEKALDEYGLVVTGKMPPDKFIEDPIQLIELKNELRMAKARIESQKELLLYKNVQVEKLYSLIDQAIQKPVHIYLQVDAKSKAEVHLSQEMQFILNFAPMIHGGLNELKEQFKEGTEEAETIQELQDSLDKMDACNSKDEITKSPAMSKFRRFLEDVEKAETTAGKVIKTAKDGFDIARRLAGYYNDIAQWCGLPQVPKPFTKK